MFILQVYGKDNDGSDREERSGEEDNETEVKEKAETITVIKKRIPKKRRVEEEEEETVLDTGLTLEEDEDLALQLLSR